MRRWVRHALVGLLAVGLVAAAGCGETELDDLAEGETFEMGELRYNILFTRPMNPGSVEDADYLTDQPPAPPGKEYLAVFLLVDNLGDEELELPTAKDFVVTDTLDREYTPLPSKSLFTFPYGEPIEGDGEVPHPDSVAASGPTAGSMILFIVDEDVVANRPLELTIDSQGEEALVELDL